MRWSESMIQKYKNGKIRIEDAIVEKMLGNATDKGKDEFSNLIKGAGPGGVAAVTMYNQSKSVYDFIKKTVEANAINAANVDFETNRMYTGDLCMGGQTACCGGTVISMNNKIDERELETRVAFYNLTHLDDQIAVEDLVTEYQNFVRGNKENNDTLVKFSASKGAGVELTIGREIITEEGFREDVQDYLKNEFGIQFRDATSEQIQEAIQDVVEDYN